MSDYSQLISDTRIAMAHGASVSSYTVERLADALESVLAENADLRLGQETHHICERAADNVEANLRDKLTAVAAAGDTLIDRPKGVVSDEWIEATGWTFGRDAEDVQP